MHCWLLTQYAIIMVQFLPGLRKIKLPAGHIPLFKVYRLRHFLMTVFTPFNSSYICLKENCAKQLNTLITLKEEIHRKTEIEHFFPKLSTPFCKITLAS